MADAEKGDKNEEISDAKKFDALADMIKDACGKLDAAGQRLDARMDAIEENQRRQDARLDARKDEDEEEERKDADEDEEEERKDSDEEEERKDARRKDEDEEERKDADEEEERKSDRKDSKRRDSEGERQKEGYVEDRKDARKDEDEDEEEKVADHAPISRAEADALRAQIIELQARAPAIITDSERDRFAAIQEQAEPAFQAFGDRAPAPLQGETPTQYKRRLGAKMQGHSTKWKDSRLSSISDDAVLDTVVNDIYADSIEAARRGVDVPAGQLRPVERSSGGHTIIEYEGAPDAWMNGFAGNSQRGTGNWLRPN